MRARNRRFAWTIFAIAAALSAGAASAATNSNNSSNSSASNNEGFLYGRLTTREGTKYEGRLRWDEEEAFWGDFFNSSKEENPWFDEAPRRARRDRGRQIEVFGFKVGSIHDHMDDGSRQFVSRFGDIARIEPHGGDRVAVTLKSGTRFELEGGSNDVEAKIRVWDGGLGVVTVEWRRIRSIEFLPTPASLAVAPARLHGKVATRDGVFTGFVQWDQDECVGTDELDGETQDGDVELRMDTIRSIERRSRRSSAVTLDDGRQLVLSGTNDVDADNRGIYVEDPRYGRVLISWDAFEKVDFTPAGSGPGYEAFRPGERLGGTVTTADGRKITGRVVFDLDESETTEMLDGERHDISYSIPFALVASIVPRNSGSKVTLVSGEELSLEGTTDVSDDNNGVLVYEGGKPQPTYVRWEDVERIDFAGPSRPPKR